MAHRPLALLLAGALASATTLAWAQKDTGQQAPQQPQQAPAGSYQDPPIRSDIPNHETYQDHEFITARDSETWRASDLMGKEVRTRNGEDAGKVKDLLIDRDRRLVAVVLQFGGVLGMGQNLVAVPAEMISVLGSEPHARTGDPQGTANVNPGAATTTSPDVKPMVNDRGTDDVPRRIVVNMTREELEKAPKFEPRPDR